MQQFESTQASVCLKNQKLGTVNINYVLLEHNLHVTTIHAAY